MDLPSGYTWLIRFRQRTWLDREIMETGPFRTFSLRIPVFSKTFRVERTLTRWL